jgi:trehalose synthase
VWHVSGSAGHVENAMYEVHVATRSIEPFERLLGRERVQGLVRQAAAVRERLGGRCVWNINSTASGGGVAEMLHSVLRYIRGLGLDVRWLVLEGPQDFFRVTKRVHNALHGSVGDGSPLGPEEVAIFERVSRQNEIAMDALLREGDLVICHDPQTAAFVPHLMRRGIRTAWRCHIGGEVHDAEVDRGWNFLRPYLEHVPLAVFTRACYAPEWLHGKRTFVVAPNIDPFSVKNEELDEPTVRAILTHIGVLQGGDGRAPTFARDDGSVGRVDRQAEVLRLGTAPRWETPLVVQVSRWDSLKDPRGVLEGFVRHVEPDAPRGAQLLLAGPTVDGVVDDPEGAAVFHQVEETWRGLPESLRRSVDLVQLPTNDNDENAAIVNAIQRHAAVVVQKSLEEGFGLTVTEAMWKRRPVIASAVGGISDQIRDGIDGVLVHDPRDLAEFGRAVDRVLGDPKLAHDLGEAAHARVCDKYLSVSALEHWALIMNHLMAA